MHQLQLPANLSLAQNYRHTWVSTKHLWVSSTGCDTQWHSVMCYVLCHIIVVC